MNANRPSDSFMVLPGMKPTYTSDPKHPGEKRLAGLTWLPNRVRYLLISMLGEFVGTFLFLFFAFAGTQVANTIASKSDTPSASVLLYIALAFGFSLAVNVWVFFRISGGLFNPAVTVALALVGAIGWLKAGLLIISQVLGGIAAAGVVSTLFPGPMPVRTTLSPDTSVVRGLFIELFLTALLVFAIFMLAAEKHKATFLAPIGIGLALFVAELAGVFFTGGSLNPARSFGPDVILRTFDSYHWIYWVGPLLGAIVAVVFYRLIKALEYETANPGADGDGRDVRYITETPVHDSQRDARRTTDGTNELDFLPPLHPINERFQAQRATASSHHNKTSGTSIPSAPQPIFRMGGDGHHSPASIDHANDRPRAQHRRSSFSSQTRSIELESERSYRSAPSAESGSVSHTASSGTSSSTT